MESVPVHSLVEALAAGAVWNMALGGLMPGIPQSRREDMAEDCLSIANAHKFDFSGWPHDELSGDPALRATAVEMLDAGLPILPFPQTVITRRTHEEGKTIDEVMLAQLWNIHGREIPGCRMYTRILSVSPWAYLGLLMTFGSSEDDDYWDADPAPHLDEEKQGMIEGAMYQLFCGAMGALHSQGPLLETVAAPDRLNRARAAKGRPPIFAYHRISLPAPVYPRDAPDEDAGVLRAAPRRHWRRGHHRHVAGRIVPVRCCLVGDAASGLVAKDYAVTNRGTFVQGNVNP